jgi:hypothetical protein
MTWGDDTCGEHQPRAAAPAPEWDTRALRAALVGLLDWCEAAQITVEPHLTPADTFDFRAAMKRARAAIKATPPRPAMAPETRRVLEECRLALGLAALSAVTDGQRVSVCAGAMNLITAHLSAHGGGND